MVNNRTQLRGFRPVLEAAAHHNRQVLFVDFDGATINPSDVLGLDKISTLSPLANFLENWGLTLDDENVVIDAILATIVENIATDVSGTTGRGTNGDFLITNTAGEFAIQLLNSRDHADPFGQPHVSRIIIGGTREQLGLPVIGISQSVDVGNFVTAETAVLLLDILSSANHRSSLNRYSLHNGVTKIDLVGIGVGNIASHEIGHFFGNLHTDNGNPLPNIMDRGGNMPNIIGVGPDTVFGNDNDVEVDLGADNYAPEELFHGTEETLQTVAFGLSTGTGIGSFWNVETGTLRYTGNLVGTDTITITSDSAPNSDNPSLVLNDGVSQDFPHATALALNLGDGDDELSIDHLMDVPKLAQISVNMGDGNDQVWLQPNAQTAIELNGGGHRVGDLLTVDVQGATITETAQAIMVADAQPIMHQNVEMVEVINAPVALPLTFRADPVTAMTGDAITYTLTVTNNSAFTVRAATLALSMPITIRNLVWVEATPNLVHLADGAHNWQILVLPPNEIGRLRFVGQVDATIRLTQTVTSTATIFLAHQTLTTPAIQNAHVTLVPPPPVGTLAGRVYVDANHDGHPNSIEESVAIVSVELYTVTELSGAGTMITATTTDANGRYQFPNLDVGAYIVRFILPSKYRSHAEQAYMVTVTAGAVTAVSLPVYEINMRVWLPNISR